MGSISSVYVGPAVKSDSQTTSPNTTENSSRSSEERVMEIHYKQEENSKGSESSPNDRYLAQENSKLVQINMELTEVVEKLQKELDKSKTVMVKDGEIFGESNEQKIARLEKLLAAERQEKWEIIERNERTRVELANHQKELAQKNIEVNELRKELENNERIVTELKLALEKSKNDTSIEFLENEEESESKPKSSKLKDELERFRAELSEKREARRKALSSFSAELNRLKDELENEKEVRRKLERDLQQQNKTDIIQDQDSASDLSIICAKKENETLKKEVNILTDDIEKLKELRTENRNLKSEIRQLSDETRTLNTVILQLKNDYKEEKRKLEKTNREKEEIQKEKDENLKMRKDLESEKEKMWEEYDKEKEEINKRTSALKEVIEISRQMLAIRESQVQELKAKLKEIEESVAHSKILEEEGLKAEYEKQLENIKTLKELYEERVRLMETERDKLRETISQHLKTIEDQKGEIVGLKEQFGTTSEELEKEKLENESLERDLKISMAKSKDFENELALMNNMFTQMLLGPFNSGNDTDLDKLTEFLQENHELITELTTKEESSEIASAFPKLLLDLLTQVEGSDNADPNAKNVNMMESTDTISEQSESILEENLGAVLPILSYKNATVFRNPTLVQIEESHENKAEEDRPRSSEGVDPAVQEIASNLPKVWKVLTELLSIHSAPEGPVPGDEKQCYKNIETPYGTKSVISVSNTFIRLKDLILEKKSLQKELVRLKQLNSHLETRLDDQEKRLSQVQCELHKTWGIVGKMRAQHQQLHNHEKILRYELQEKRIMLSELKQELEYCRDKWERARQKNAESETEWKKLRKEFAARKVKSDANSNLNDSAESGFSDEPNESSEEAENFDADRSGTQSPIDKKLDPEEGTSKGAVPKIRDGNKSSDKSKSRAIRLKRLEDQCQLLVRQVDITTHKSNFLSNRLEELHEHHAGSEEIHLPITLKNQAEPPVSLAQTSQTEEAAVCLEQMEAAQPLAYASVGNETDSRAERLKRLEQESQAFVKKMHDTVQRGSDLSNRLQVIHEEYVSYEENRSPISEATDPNDEEKISTSEIKEDRLQRLESEARSLISDVTNTVKKSESLSEPLEKVHENCLRREAETQSNQVKNEKLETSSSKSSDSPREQVENGSERLQKIPPEPKAERLKRLENEGLSLLSNAINTVEKSETLSNRLDEMHAKCLKREASRENRDEKTEATEKVEQVHHKESISVARNVRLQDEAQAVEKSDGSTKNLDGSEQQKDAKEERLTKLENEGTSLVSTVTGTVQKSLDLCSKLDEIHQKYLDYEASKEKEKVIKQERLELRNSEAISSDNLQESQDENSRQETFRGAIPKTETKAERLKRLEEESRSLMKKVRNTVQKSDDLSNKLEDIHDTYVNYEVSKMTFAEPESSNVRNEPENSGEKTDKEKNSQESDKNDS